MEVIRHPRTLEALAVLAAVLAGMRTAEGAFPGTNGKIVFVSNRSFGTGVNNPEEDNEIFTMNPDGTEVQQLTENDDNDVQPRWSDNGAQIAFASNRDGNFEIYRMAASGAGETRTTNNTVPDTDPSYSPDGTQMVFSSFRNGDNDIYKMSVNGSNQVRLTKSAAADATPSWSPSGSRSPS